MVRWITAAAVLTLTAPAFAQATMSVTLPTGRTIDAEVVSQPAEGSVEHAILASLTMLTQQGDFGGFMATWCDPGTCGDPRQQEQMTTYNLPAAQRTGGACVHGENSDQLVITKRREENGNQTEFSPVSSRFARKLSMTIGRFASRTPETRGN